MASLTDQISTPNQGKPIIAPDPVAPSILGAIADFGAGAASGLSRLGQEREQRNARAAAAQDDRARDELVGRVFDIRREESATPDWQGGVDSNFALPQAAMNRADEILRAQRAVGQGRGSQAMLDMRIENLVAELYQKYPDSRFEVATAMQGLGINHYLFRAETEARKMAETEQEAQMGALTTQFEFAARAGLVTNNTSLEDGAEIGRQAMEAQAQIAAAERRAAAVRADRTLNNEERKTEQEAAARSASSALIAQASIAISPLIDQTTIALSAAGNDAQRQTSLAEFRTRTSAALIAYGNRGVAQIAAMGGGPDEIKAFQTYIQGQQQALEALYTDSFESNTMAMRNIQATFQLDAARAAPMYSRIVALIGQPAANQLFGDVNGMQNLAPEVVESVRNEMQNVDPTTARGTVSLARMLGYLRGDVKLQDLTAEAATQYVRANAQALLGNQAAVLAGNNAAIRPWMQSYGNVAEAVAELAPTATTASTMRTATGQLSTPEARRVLAQAIREDLEFGTALAQASRAGAAKMLGIARALPGSGPFRTQYNAQTGRFEALLTRELYDDWASRQFSTNLPTDPRLAGRLAARGGTTPRLPSFEDMRRQIPDEINNQLTVLNANLTHLVETDQYDQAIPRTLSPRERRAMYATGRTPDSMRARPEGATQESEWGRIRGNLDTTIQGLLTETVSSPLPNPTRDRLMNYEARRVGINEVPASVQTLGQFSEFARQVNRAGADSSAAGIYQITGATLRGRNEQNGYAERVFGANWRDVPWNAENQDKIAEAIFNDNRGTAEALRKQWVSLSLEEAERVRRMPWAQARRIIAQGESGE